MEVEVKIDKKCEKPKVIIYTNEIDEEITNIINEISACNKSIIKVYKDEKMYLIEQEKIETVYSQNGKIYIRFNNEIYTSKNRLYELEEILNKKIFVRISNSEIVNFNKVENIDFKIIGTLVINFKSGNKAYVSRRYIPKIKKYLEM